jgi:adenylosuccinate synthase
MRTKRSASVVIGAAYGDEGKGLMTDSIVADRHGGDALVVRFNGGAQAGHTVTLPDGRRHVFHHVGSGALAGAPTHLSRFFIANPIVLRSEWAELAALNVQPVISLDPDAPVTMPTDMMTNQIIERARGTARHGSCGIGIGETIERNLNPAYRLLARDLHDANKLSGLLQRVALEWAPARLARLGLATLSNDERALLTNGAIVEQWLTDVRWFCEVVRIGAPAMHQPIVFEGAQGLLLDQHRGAFPYVTRSNTGLKNVMALAPEYGVEALDIIYMSRIYTTRHGAGPLAHAYDDKPYAGIVDETNQPNPWQGTLRFGALDLDVLSSAIADDLSDLRGAGLSASVALGVTCLDQVGTQVAYYDGGNRCSATPDDLALRAAARVSDGRLLVSRGPTRKTVESYVYTPSQLSTRKAS